MPRAIEQKEAPDLLVFFRPLSLVTFEIMRSEAKTAHISLISIRSPSLAYPTF